MAAHDIMTCSVEGVLAFVRVRHEGQTDKLGGDYVACHLQPVAARLRPLGVEAEAAGLLHDVLEDTTTTQQDLVQLGVSERVVEAVQSVTRRAGESYADSICRAAAHPLGRYVKLADNAHNLSLNERLARSDPETAARLLEKYETARQALLAAGPDLPFK